MLAAVDVARARVQLLGGSVGAEAEAGTAEVVVPAPIDGTVIERSANAGLNVDASSSLFTVADLASVWIVAELYSRTSPACTSGSLRP
jgi:multidrug resistance efflux pump